MKTLNEIYGEIMASDALKKEYFAAANEGRAVEFLSLHGCDTSAEELGAFLVGIHHPAQGEVADDELDSVAGGTCYHDEHPVVTIYNTCDYWLCDSCHMNRVEPESYSTGCVGTCPICRTSAYCDSCMFHGFSDCLMLCYHPFRLNN